jgi:hypothetical protein
MFQRSVVAVIALVGVGAVATVFATRSFNSQVNNSIVVQRLAQAVKRSRGSDGQYPINIDDLYSEKERNVLYVSNGRHFVLVAGSGGRSPRPGYERWLTDGASLDAKSNCLNPWADTVFTDRGPVVYCLK